MLHISFNALLLLQVASHPRPLPQPPTSARSQSSRPVSGDTHRSNVSNTGTVSMAKPATSVASFTSVYNELPPQSQSVQSIKNESEIKTTSAGITTSKPAVPIITSKPHPQPSLTAVNFNKEFANSGLGRIIAAPTVQKQLFADQTFSNKDGYRRTVVTVSDRTTQENLDNVRKKCDVTVNGNGSSITQGVVQSNRVNSILSSPVKSSIPQPGAAKEQSQSIAPSSELSEKLSPAKTVKQIMPFSKGLSKSGRSLTSGHLSIKPPAGPHKDSTFKVRNLNYTPTKPYSEVSECGSGTSEPCSETNSSCSSPQPPNSITSNGKCDFFVM